MPRPHPYAAKRCPNCRQDVMFEDKIDYRICTNCAHRVDPIDEPPEQRLSGLIAFAAIWVIVCATVFALTR